jgi:DNA-binding transcriptional regulator YiaG
LHYLRVGDQRKQRGPANDVADQNRDEKIREHRQDTEMSVQDMSSPASVADQKVKRWKRQKVPEASADNSVYAMLLLTGVNPRRGRRRPSISINLA